MRSPLRPAVRMGTGAVTVLVWHWFGIGAGLVAFFAASLVIWRLTGKESGG